MKEYRILRTNGTEGVSGDQVAEEALNDCAKDGWTVVGVTRDPLAWWRIVLEREAREKG